MIHFYQSAFMEALGWTLVDSFWKMGSLWIAYLLITRNGKWQSAATRYSLAVVLMLIGTIWSFSCLPGYYNAIAGGREVPAFISSLRQDLSVFTIGPWLMPLLSVSYSSITLFLLSRLIIQYYAHRKLLLKDLTHAPVQITDTMLALAKKMGLSKRVAMHLSGVAATPLTIGFFKPVILLPIAMVNQLSIEQASAVVAHELFHIRRHDYIVNILVSVSTVVLFFNPFARLFRNAICTEREHACDDGVMKLGFNNWQYAHALYVLGRHTNTSPTFAMAATGRRPLLLQRISRLMDRPYRNGSGALLVLTAKAAALFFLCVFVTVFVGTPAKNIAAKVDKDIVQMAALPIPGAPVSSSREPAVTVEKQILLVAPKRNKEAASIRTISRSRQIAIDIPSPPAKPTPGVRVRVNGPEVMVHSFASAVEPIHFTLVLPQPAPQPVPQEALSPMAPYVPSATFYYSIIEDSLSADGRKVIHL